MQAILLLIEAMVSGFAWFTQVFTKAGLMDIFSGVMIITLVFYRILSPMLRSAGSDRSNKKRGEKEKHE